MDPYQPSQAYQREFPPTFAGAGEAQKHASLGIASFVLSILSGLGVFGTVVTAGVLEASNPAGVDETSGVAVVVGLLIFLFFFLQLVAIGLGIGGLFQTGRKKLFSILGIVFSGAALFGVLGLMFIGLTMAK